ncbi:MAG: cytochrome c oxidase assembly protein [Nocardioidaceae bacterium]
MTSALGGRADAVRWGAGTLLVAGAVLVVVLLAGGGAPQPVPAGLPDAGPLTGWALPAARLAADLAGFAAVGLLLAAGVLLPAPDGRLRPVALRETLWAVRAAVVWLVAVAAEAVLTVSDILGVPLGRATDPAVLRSFLTQVPQGRALVVQAVLVVVVAGIARSALSSRGCTVGTFVALLALTPPGLTGHSAAAGSHDLAVASLLVHMLAASLWVGGLAGVAFAAFAGSSGVRLAVPRFSTLAGWCFCIVAASGVVNAGVRLGGLTPLVTSPYGRLVLAKVAALGVLGGFGWWHRRHTVSHLERTGTIAVFGRVAAGELVVMAATIALAVGLSRTPTPVGQVVDTSRAADLLGFPLPPAPTLGRYLLGWTPDGFALAFLALAGSLYLTGLLVLRRRGVRWPVGRTLSWYAGLLLFAWASVGGVGLYAHVLFSAHMVAHMVLSMIAPIGLVLGAPVTLALRTLPGARVPGEPGPRQLLLAVLHSRVVRVLSHPLVALALFVGSLYGLYFTTLFPTLMSNHLGHVAMEFHFLAVGCLFFWVLIGVDPTPRRWHPFARIGLLLAAMPFHAFFAIALMSTPGVLARDYFAALHRPYATSLRADQHLGGGITWALSELPIMAVVAAIFVQWVLADRREAARLDRAADRAEAGTADDELARYNAYLSAINRTPDAAPTSPGRRDERRGPGPGR